MAEIDSLEVKIQAEASNANSALTTLIKKFDSLSASLSKLNGSGMQEFSKGMSELTASMQGMKNVNSSVFTKTAKGLQKFETIDGAKLNSVSNAVRPLADTMRVFNTVQFDNTNLTNFVNSMARLGNSNLQNLNTVNFSKLANNMIALTNAMSLAKDVPSTTVRFVSAMARLASAGDKVQIVSASLPKLRKEMLHFVNAMSKAGTVSQGTIQFTTAIAQLASAGKKVDITATNLERLAQELKKFFLAMQSAPQVSQNTIQLVSALGNLQNGTTRINLGSLNGGFRSLLPQLGRANGGFKSLAYTFGKFYANCWLLIRGLRMLGKAIDLSSQLTEVQNVVDVSFGQFKGAMEDFTKTSMESFGITELSAKKIGSRFQAMANSMGLVNAQAQKANSWLSTQNLGYSKLGNTVADMSVNLTKLSADYASFFDTDVNDVAEDMQSVITGMTKPLRKYGLDLTQATLQEWALRNGINANVATMSQAEKTMLRYQYVMANSKNAMNDYARTHDTFANRVRLLKQQFQQLAIVIGNSLVNALKPALRALNTAMNAIIRFATVISNALGKIFGWTYEGSEGALTEDLEGASDYAEDTADGLGKAKDNAKKLKQQLQGFDELNVLTTNKDSDGGGGKGKGSGASGSAGGGSDVGGQWKQTEKAYESFINDLYGLGDYIGTTLTKTLNGIDWNSIYQGAKNFGTGLAQFLNGLISPELFSAVAKTIASSLNTALYALNSFGKEFNWENLGNSIASGINEFFQTFDAHNLADTINTWIKGALSTVHTFFKKTDFEMIGQKIGEFLSDLDFGAYLHDIAQCLWDALKGALDVLKGIMKEAPFESAIIAGMAGWKLLGVGDKLAGLVGKALQLSGISVSSIALRIGAVTVAAVAGFNIGEKIYEAITKEDTSNIEWGDYTGENFELKEWIDAGFEVLTDIQVTIGNFFLPDGKKVDAKDWKNFLRAFLAYLFGSDDVKEPAKQTIEFYVKGYIDKTAENIRDFFLKYTSLGRKIDFIANFIGWDKDKSFSDNITDMKAKIESWYLGGNFVKVIEFSAKLLSWLLGGNFGKTIDFIAQLTGWKKKEGKGGFVNTIGDMVACFYDRTKGKGFDSTVYDMNASFKTKEKGKGWSSTMGEMKAQFTNWEKKGGKNGFNSTIGSMKAKFTSWTLAKGFSVVIDAVAQITGATKKNTKKSNSKKKVAKHAKGGFPEDGWFRASRGEIMGKFDNGQSVVANNAQITKGISIAVHDGNMENNNLLRQELSMMERQNELLYQILQKDGISKGDLFNSIRSSAREYTNRTGNPAF